jgi:hypothetical protein
LEKSRSKATQPDGYYNDSLTEGLNIEGGKQPLDPTKDSALISQNLLD